MRGVLSIIGAFAIVATGCTSHPLARIVDRDADTSRAGGSPADDGSVESTRDAGTLVTATDAVIAVIAPATPSSDAVPLAPDGEPDGAVIGDAILLKDTAVAADRQSPSTVDAPLPRDGAVLDGVVRMQDLNSRQEPDAAPMDSLGMTCALDPAPNVVLCDDFSNPAPQTTRTIVPWPDLTSMQVAITGGTAVIKDPGSWSSSFVEWGSEMDFRDTSAEVDMTAKTASRSLSYIIWGEPPTYLSAGLQRDEQALYLHVVVNDVVVARLSGAAKMAPKQTQRVKMEIHADGQIQCSVDGKVVLTTKQDLSVFPATLAPGIGANSYPSQEFTFDNFVVRKLTDG
jgi:hypothetical protein